MRRLLSIVFIMWVATAACRAGDVGAPSVLPKEFAGWHMAGRAKASTNPQQADPTNAALLREYAFTGLQAATYTRGDGRKLVIKAASFEDVSDAYGVFAYYRAPEMLTEKIGDQGASLDRRVLFYKGNVLVDALFDQLTAMSAAQLRELAGQLTQPAGGAGKPASVLFYLPRGPSSRGVPKYIVGPVGLQRANASLPSELVDFNAGAEVALDTYSGADRDAMLLVVNYPTVQIASSHLSRLEAAEQQNAQQPGSVPALPTGAIYSKRSGPLMVVVSGKISPGDARSLLASVNYDANVTWNEANPFKTTGDMGSLVVNALILSGILMIIGLIFSFAFGGVRVLLGRLIPGKVRPPEASDFISLGLEEGGSAGRDSDLSSTIKAG